LRLGTHGFRLGGLLQRSIPARFKTSTQRKQVILGESRLSVPALDVAGREDHLLALRACSKCSSPSISAGLVESSSPTDAGTPHCGLEPIVFDWTVYY
jgi:hypothetical protein